ncbi:MAG: YaaC family protein [Steroidobacteraceae bacterium]
MRWHSIAQSSTLLTAPLTLYYSFLNLMRAYVTLRHEVQAGKGHGLSFHAAPSLFESEASLRQGTFADYLDHAGIKWKVGDRISLRDALGCVVELWRDVTTIDVTMSHVQRVEVSAQINGDFSLRFHDYPASSDFLRDWRADFPRLVASCDNPDGFRLFVRKDACGRGRDDVAKFLAKNLDYSLPFLEAPIWWTIRQSRPFLKLDRIGYYHVAAFILGNAVLSGACEDAARRYAGRGRSGA